MRSQAELQHLVDVYTEEYELNPTEDLLALVTRLKGLIHDEPEPSDSEPVEPEDGN